MFYLVHIIGYLCQSLFHLVHVLPLLLKLQTKWHVISGGNCNIYTHSICFAWRHEWHSVAVFTVICGAKRHETRQNTRKGIILYESDARSIHRQYVLLCVRQAVKLWPSGWRKISQRWRDARHGHREQVYWQIWQPVKPWVQIAAFYFHPTERSPALVLDLKNLTLTKNTWSLIPFLLFSFPFSPFRSVALAARRKPHNELAVAYGRLLSIHTAFSCFLSAPLGNHSALPLKTELLPPDHSAWCTLT